MYYINKHSRINELKGIYVLCNTENRAVIGLDDKGYKDWRKICDNDMDSVTDVEFIKTLYELEFISKSAYEYKDNIEVLSAYVHVTNKCNLHCLGCYSLDDERNKSIDPSSEELIKAFFELDAIGVTTIVISGGEPFLRKDLKHILQYARENFKNLEHISLITNGTVNVNFEEYKGLLDEITVSVDGYSLEHSSFIRDTGIFDTIINTVKTIKQSGVPVNILPTLHNKNYSNVTEYMLLAKELGVEINFSILSVCETAEFKDYILHEQGLGVLADALFDIELPVHDVPISCELEAGLSCGTGRTTISIAANGNVYPCHMLHNDAFLMGNIFTQSFKEIYANNPVVKTLDAVDVDNIEDCKGCGYKYFCAAGCRARSLYATGTILNKDSYCFLTKRYYDRTTDELIQGIEHIKNN